MKITKQESYTIELSRAEIALIYVTIGASSITSREKAFTADNSNLVSREEFNKINNSGIYEQLSSTLEGK